MLTLRPFSTSDYPLLARWFTSLPEVVQWGGSHVSYPLTATDMDVMLREGPVSYTHLDVYKRQPISRC